MDITACVNARCEKRHGCLRYRVVWSERWQSVSHFFVQPGGVCLHFSGLREGDPLVTEDEADKRAEAK